MRESAGRTTCALIAAAFMLVSVAVYIRVSSHEFIRYDDNAYLWENGRVPQGLSWSNVKWAFTTTSVCNWHPLTWLSHMLDCELFDGIKRPGAHHMMSVAIHAINAALLFGLLNFMTKKTWRSAMVAALFALHPLHVESVAWVAERKDVLSTMFGFLSIWCYAIWCMRSLRKWYWLSLLCFALSLMAKPMLVTLPCVLLLLDVWPLGRIRFGTSLFTASSPTNGRGRRGANRNTPVPGSDQSTRPIPVLLLEKLPYFIFSIASSAITMYAQKIGGAVYSFDLLPMHRRIANALVAYAMYLEKMFWPVDLAVMYPLPKEVSGVAVAGPFVVLGIVCVTVAVLSRKRPWLGVGWLWFLGTLVPVIGILQVGLQSMADRYTYVPYIGVFIMIVWSVPELSRLTRLQVTAIATTCALILTALAICTVKQLRHWRDGESLFRHAIDVTKDNYIAHNMLGFALAGQKRTDEAIEQYQKAIRIHYKFPAAHANLGAALMVKRDFAGAEKQYRIALEMIPDTWLGQQNLGAALVEMNRFEEAAVHFREALRIRPDFPEAHLGLARSLRALNRMQEAIPEYEAVLRNDDGNFEAQIGLGVAFAALEQDDEAEHHFLRAVEIKPDDADAHFRLGLARAFQDRFDDAIIEFQESLRLQPGNVEVQNYLNLARQKRDKAKSQ